VIQVNMEDTIAAIASAPGGALRGILRLSGPGVVSCLRPCFRADREGDLSACTRPSLIRGQLQLSGPLGDVPCDLYLWPGSRSYTRQPAAELHTIGSPPLLDAALRAVCAAGARLAEPGEFTLRAFLAGRLDLTQAEAVLGVTDARSRQELDVALSQLAGGLAGPLRQLRERLLDLLAHLEAGLDFVDEDIEFISAVELQAELADAAAAVARLESQMASRGESADEFRIVLVGWPNVGKSSLLNALVGEQAAIVSEVAGTTRDYLTRHTSMDGLPCMLIDTAGIETESRGGVADIAQTFATQQAEQAHVQLLCLDATRRLNAWERAVLQADAPTNRIVVLTKIDSQRATDLALEAVETSSRTGEGLPALRRAIFDMLSTNVADEGCVAGTAIRCRESLRRAAEALGHARQAADEQRGDEIVAAEIRLALDELGQVVGAVYTDDVLERIFSRFCIGK
jgi:tRNA modification GTPase